MRSIKSLACALALIATPGAFAAEPSPVAHYQPKIDITKDIGCGTKLATSAERIAHNRKLAELYYINFQQDRERGRNNDWRVHNCVAEGADILLGAVDPLGEPSKWPANATRNPAELSGEQRGYFAVFPDWGTIPNTLAVVPFEGGAFFRMMYGGHDKDGKYYSIWETNLILVNDEGRITHFEMWNDSIGFDATTKKIFGKSILNLGLSGYGGATEAFPKTPPR